MAGRTVTRKRRSVEDLFTLYLDEAGSVPLLTRDQEVLLAQQIERGGADGEAARRQFVSANLRLVVAVARTFQNRGLAMPDLVQEGNAGLLRAVDRFDWRKGFKFSTYAVWWIRQAIQRALQAQGHAVKLTSTAADDLAKLHRATAELELAGRFAPSVDELAASTGIAATRVVDLIGAVAAPRSLDEPIGEQDGGVLGDLVADETDVAEHAMRSSYGTVITRMLDSLDERERALLTLRYGLDGRDAQTLNETATALNITRERVRQIEARALSKLRHPSVDPAARELLAG